MMVTHSLTYDPVVDAKRLPRSRPLRTPPPGRALVLVPEGGPALTVRPGEPVPDVRGGAYRGMFLVDTAEHRLALGLRLPGRDAPDAFHCHVRLMCQVTDPAAIVARGIRDMSAAWHDPLHVQLRDVSRRYGTEQLREAQGALNAALRHITGAPTVRLYDARAELRSDAPGPSRVRGVRARGSGDAAEPKVPGGPEVLRGEVLARREEPLPPPPPSTPPSPPPSP
ncbi:hypothetical protein L0P92_44720, partial [Streptomyces muensis]|nr:hypothetical protein [Streptomyces muensis]